MKTTITLILAITSALFSLAQTEPILISEQTIKVRKAQEFYFGFAAGDEIIFDMEVLKGKNIKEVEIIEYPSTSKFYDFKSKGIHQKRIKVNKTAIYKFTIKGGGVKTKVCRATISRIPASQEFVNFDTSVKWKTRLDSTYIQRFSKELISIDTSVVAITDRVERVHSQTNLDNPNWSSFNITLPPNERTKLSTKELVSWGYWIGVGNEGQAAYEKEKKRFLLKTASKLSAIDPVGGLALGGYAILVNPPKGHNVQYQFSGIQNGVVYNFVKGNSVISSGRVTDITQGSFTITLQNDNLTKGINVNVKVSAVIVTKQYFNKPYQQLKVKKTEYPVLSTSK